MLFRLFQWSQIHKNQENQIRTDMLTYNEINQRNKSEEKKEEEKKKTKQYQCNTIANKQRIWNWNEAAFGETMVKTIGHSVQCWAAIKLK